MKNIQQRIKEEFGNKLRVRVCGICIKENSILMVNHSSLSESDHFWAPPGGGMEYGQTAEENLKREFMEETGLEIEVEKFLFVYEYLKPPLHAVELFFKVKEVGGKLITGYDPEMKKTEQIISDVQYISIESLIKMDKKIVHQILSKLKNINSIGNLRGYSRNED